MNRIRIISLTAIVALCFGTCVLAADPSVENNVEPRKSVAAKARLVDINTATEDQLKAVPGVGDEYAKKIIVGRPYANIDQLKSKGIIPADVYGKIAKLIRTLC
jgi:DNA uptake protein ComE-like DNA-binding protein